MATTPEPSHMWAGAEGSRTPTRGGTGSTNPVAKNQWSQADNHRAPTRAVSQKNNPRAKWPGVASGAVAWAPRRAHHVTTWSTPRHPHASRPFPIDAILADPPLKGRGSAPSPQPHHRRSPPAACFPTHPHLSVALRRLGACGPGRGRARASLWGGLPRRVPPVVPDEAAALRSRISPAPRLWHLRPRHPRGSEGQLEARGGSEGIGGSGRRGGSEGLRGCGGSCTRAHSGWHTLASTIRYLAVLQMKFLPLGPHKQCASGSLLPVAANFGRPQKLTFNIDRAASSSNSVLAERAQPEEQDGSNSREMHGG